MKDVVANNFVDQGIMIQAEFDDQYHVVDYISVQPGFHSSISLKPVLNTVKEQIISLQPMSCREDLSLSVFDGKFQFY